MGGGSSKSSPPPESASDREAREEREAADREAREEAAAQADEDAEAKEVDEQERETEKENTRAERKTKRLDEAKKRRGFQRPEPVKEALSIRTSGNCNSCKLTVDPTLSSATVVLTRNILGKIRPPGQNTVPSNLPFAPNAEFKEKGFMALKGAPDCSGGCWYVPPHPSQGDAGHPKTDKSVAKGTLLSDADIHWENNSLTYGVTYWNQYVEEQKNRKKFIKEMLKHRVVRIWNPSDDPLDRSGSHAINYENHGALTKLYLKPTIPFQFSFDPTGLMPPPPPPLAQRIESK
jgi:hypothetical protein